MKRLFFLIAAVALAVSSMSAQEPYKYNAFYFQRATIFDELPIDSTDIVMLGNSLTNGCEWHELLGMPNVKNRGISSDVVQGVADRLGPVIKGQPKKIFLMTGLNDISHDLTADSVATALGNLIDTIRRDSPRTQLYVESLLPINISYGMYKGMLGKDDIIVEVNKQLAAMADDKGFTWVNLYPHFCDEDGHMRSDLTNDGIHLLGKGYLIWRDVILPYINE